MLFQQPGGFRVQDVESRIWGSGHSDLRAFWFPFRVRAEGLESRLQRASRAGFRAFGVQDESVRDVGLGSWCIWGFPKIGDPNIVP